MAMTDGQVQDDGSTAGSTTDGRRTSTDGDRVPAVRVADVRKSYAETTALDGVSLSVDQGEVVGLLGPNGAGKTTLVRAITGTTGVEGSVRVFGRPPDAFDRSRIGVLPQTFDPPERLTARELLAYYGGLYDDAQSPGEVLATVGVADSAATRYDRLSGGQRRRVALAAALVNDPDLLVLDEPTAGIDPAGARAVRERITALAAGGTTVVVTGHDVDAVEALADRVALLDDGELVAAGRPADLVAEHGGASRLFVATDDAVPDRLAGHETARTERGVVVRDVERSAVGTVVDALADADVAYAALRWSRPSLEDVYLALTGHPDLAGVVGAGDLNRAAAVAGDGRDGESRVSPAGTDGGDRQ